MKRQDVEKIVTQYLKPIFGFALKRCKTSQDAEDISQEIVMKAYCALLARDDIENTDKFIWAIAHNSLNNYYRDNATTIIGVSLDEVANSISDPTADFLDDDKDDIRRLQGEIAYLSKLQRQIVIAYYFENRKQADIAEALGIPLGTVKWHLFESKKELKRGMDTMRKASELKFNPIKFEYVSFNGSVGTHRATDFLEASLVQNICYCVRNTAKTVNEIADDLGVSPVYVEGEIETLEKEGFLLESKNKYIANFIINEPTRELLVMRDKMYKQAASLFANDLYDELADSGILDDPDILCGQTDDPISLTRSPKRDHNFILWTLIPYIAAYSGEKLMDNKISFEEVATIRPRGGRNIVNVSVFPDNLELPADYVHMNNWCGPMWNTHKGKKLWQIDSEWCSRDYWNKNDYPRDCNRIISLFDREFNNDRLSKDEYAWLAEKGYVKTNGDYDGHFKSSWQVVVFANKDIEKKLLDIGEKIKAKYKDEFEAIKAPYVKAVLDSIPAHVRKAKEYELQFMFNSDGWFLLHCVHELVNNGKLQLPTKGQRKSLTTLIVNE